jgi:hypothetical protein
MVYNKWVTKAIFCIVSRKNIQTRAETDITIDKKIFRIIRHNYDTSIMETKISILQPQWATKDPSAPWARFKYQFCILVSRGQVYL